MNQLFGRGAAGETIFYPNGAAGRGYLVPAEREASVRSAVRWLSFGSVFGTMAVLLFVPRMIEARLGYEIPLPWFLGGALVVAVVSITAAIWALSRISEGLTPVSK